MNDEIKELYELATKKAGIQYGFEVSHRHIAETFSELIINECSELVEHILKEGGGNYGDLIKEHFGLT